MKNTIVLAIAAAALSSCVTTVSTSTLPDGTTVKVTSKTTDAAAINNAVAAAQALAPVIKDLTKKQNSAPAPSTTPVAP